MTTKKVQRKGAKKTRSHFDKVIQSLDALYGKASRNATIEKMAEQYEDPNNKVVLGYNTVLNKQTAYFYHHKVKDLKGERQAELDKRVRTHLKNMESGTFHNSTISMAYVRETRSLHKIDGNGRSFANLQYWERCEESGEFPNPFPITVQIFYCKTLRDATSLYNSFDQKTSSRKRRHQMNVVIENSGIEFLESHTDKKVLDQYQKGLLFMHENYMDYPRKNPIDDEVDSMALLIEFSHLLEEIDPILGPPYDMGKHIWEVPPLMAVMLYTFHVSGEETEHAEKFWNMMVDFASTAKKSNKDPVAAMIYYLYRKANNYVRSGKSPISRDKRTGKFPAPSVINRALGNMAAKAWNAYLQKNPLQRLPYTKNKALILPLAPEDIFDFAS